MNLSNPDQPVVEVVVEYPAPVEARHHVSVKQESIKQSRDRAQYTRQQKGHSLTLHLLLGGVVLWIPAIYFSCSPNHYWHA